MCSTLQGRSGSPQTRCVCYATTSRLALGCTQGASQPSWTAGIRRGHKHIECVQVRVPALSVLPKEPVLLEACTGTSA